MRTVILHYHLFKNAGTSVDHILRQNFADAWVSREFSAKGGSNTGEVIQWIRETPGGIAFSSHTMIGPLPQIDGIQVVPVMLLRDPIDRIRSAYAFERMQKAETKGAQLAKAHDLAGYVNARFAIPGDRQCRNFQTARLASLAPGPQPELTRAIEAARHLQTNGVLGLVPNLRAAMMELSGCVAVTLGALDIPDVRANRTQTPRATMTTAMLNHLIRNNSDDLALLDHIRRQNCAA
jgi:hypothetical protein